MTDLQAYARRIGYDGTIEPTLDVLTEIIWLHQLAIPFENLDIFLLKRPISLRPEDIFAKLVSAGRGGFCFEQNGLLAQVLEVIGFGVTFGYATWQPDEGERIVPFDHQVLQVHIPGEPHPWLADVGFGRETPAGPLPLRHDIEARTPRTVVEHRTRRLDDPDLQWSIEHRQPGDAWRTLYDLDLRPRTINDFEGRSQFNQQSPQSHFTRGVICSRPLSEGSRITVTTNELIRTTPSGQREETPLSTLSALLDELDTWFGIHIEEWELPRRDLQTQTCGG